jgi:ketosteroid isomerase-like protein
MNRGVIVLFAGILICFLYAARAQESSTAEAERYIKESERLWAESVANGDASVVERILADDYVGVDPDGGFYDKAKMVSGTREAPKEYISNHLNEVKVRFFGDTAVAQGSESWVRRRGSPLRGRFVWTDTWIRRNGKWQIVAAEDLIAPETSK